MTLHPIKLRFSFPSKRRHPYLLPFFLPFQGCPERCIFCAQDQTTGCSSNPPLLDRLRALQAQLQKHMTPKPELAFFGGTFTLLDTDSFSACLSTAHTLREAGAITGFRCSTRPDALSPDRLNALAQSGCTCIELGIQSFSDTALAQSRRGYTGEGAFAACKSVLAAGFQLGVQLLPGMPGVDADVFVRDVSVAIAAGASMLRFYPCLVLEGTMLARLFREGLYQPWTMEQTIDALAKGYVIAQSNHVPVIRMGLVLEPSMRILAGPVHPALGARVKAKALYLAVLRTLACAGKQRVYALRLPASYQGFFWGDCGDMREKWRMMGLEEIVFEKRQDVELFVE
ncbi:MAG: radical SAM protein [Desulfovibrio sp.]|nr:radical SAM protein [Desulfovibrio sp.]